MTQELARYERHPKRQGAIYVFLLGAAGLMLDFIISWVYVVVMRRFSCTRPTRCSRAPKTAAAAGSVCPKLNISYIY
jgi:hypothetical protein